MMNRSVLVILACSSYILVIQTLFPMAIALRIAPNADELMIENHRTRTRTRQNYMVQRALDEELSANMDLASIPVAEAVVDTEANLEEQPQMEDYGNLIRKNDIYFLDNSIETTTRKRGMKKRNHAFPESPCSCDSGDKHMIPLGPYYFPSSLESRKCLNVCPFPYRCKEQNYQVTVLKERPSSMLPSEASVQLPTNIRLHWDLEWKNITAACICAEN